MDIRCNECNKYLFSIENGKSLGYAGAIAQEKGFVYKNACLYSDKYNSLFFCSHKCGKEFYSRNIPKDAEVTKKLNDLKSDIPKMAKECAEGLAKIQSVFNKKNKQ